MKENKEGIWICSHSGGVLWC